VEEGFSKILGNDLTGWINHKGEKLVGLQDHGMIVWYRNIKIKQLD